MCGVCDGVVFVMCVVFVMVWCLGCACGVCNVGVVCV